MESESQRQKSVRARLARLPAVVHAVHDKGKFLVLGLLKTFFDKADDSLFELADKAQSNQEQNLYFDSMREVRVQRRTVEKHFADVIDEAFASLAAPAKRSEPADNNVDPENLTLLENEELEEMVAVDAAVARANQEFGEAIQFISLRLDSLVPIKVYQKNNPLSPQIICDAFMSEAKTLDIGIKAKLVLFKLFDKSVVNRLDAVYRPVNELFKDHNVLPSLTTATMNRRRRSSDRESSSSGPQNWSSNGGSEADQSSAGQSSVSPEVLSTLRTLIGDRIGDQESMGDAQVANQAQVDANALLQLLSKVQQMPSIMGSGVTINVKDLLSKVEEKTGVVANIGRVDDQVMNLVNLLFDFILEDRNLAAPMKALISRMQIPIIKVAVVDKTFFTKGGHVARRLLNEMATAAMGWSGDESTVSRDPLYKKIDAIVTRLVQDFDTDLSIFSELLAELSEFLEKEKKRAAVLERRTIDAEDGKAKAEVARTTVSLEVEVRVKDYELPKVVNHLIKDAWSNVLFVTALKYGYDSKEWKLYLRVLEELVWSVQPPKTSEHRQRLIKIVPSLLKKLRSGLDTISFNPFEMSDLFKSLEKIHIACIRGKLPSKPEQPQEPAEPAKSVDTKPAAPAEPEVEVAPTPENPSPTTTEHTDNPEITQNSSAQSPVNGTPVRPAVDDGADEEIELVAKPPELDSVDELLGDIGGEPTEAAVPNAVPVSPPVEQALAPDDPYMQQVRSFVQGAWFDIKSDSGEGMRCRLAAFIKPTGKYIFVNRNGMKVMEKTQSELAIALKNNALSALDNSVLFDRALETVVTSLRKS